MTSNFPFCFAILAFGRPDDLLRVVAQISHYFPTAQIVVLVDRYEGSEEIIHQANAKTIEIGRQLLSSGEITHLEIPQSNLRTKRAWKSLMEMSFTLSDSVVYIEDDLLFVKDPGPFLSWVSELFLQSNLVAFATLYTSREHKTREGSRGRLTDWPESWGVVIHKEKYHLLQHAISDVHTHGLHEIKYFERLPNSILVRLMRKRFKSVWLYKFRKALASDTSWDTELHLGLWLLGMQCLAPDVSYLEDTGVHFTSVSPSKALRTIQACKKKSRRQSMGLSSARKLQYCTGCERNSEERGYMFLPEIVKVIISMVPSIRFGR